MRSLSGEHGERLGVQHERRDGAEIVPQGDPFLAPIPTNVDFKGPDDYVMVGHVIWGCAWCRRVSCRSDGLSVW